MKNVAEQSPLKQKIFHAALRVARQRNELLEFQKPVGSWLNFKWKMADKVVLSKIRDKLGGRLE